MPVLLTSPSPAQVVIFDRESSEALATMVLADIPYVILETRKERYFLGMAVILEIVARLHLLFESRPFAWRHMPRFWVGQLYRIYQLACLAVMRPKVVLTYIDNSYNFQWLSRRFPGALFLAVQNGVRSPYDVSAWLPPHPHPARTISMPVMFCFGAYERDLYEQHGHRVDSFRPVGSLRGSYYRSVVSRSSPAMRAELCLVSQWSQGLEADGGSVPEIRQSLVRLHEFLHRYVAEAGVSLRVAMRSADEWEKAYFRRELGDRIEAVPNNPREMSTYRAMDESNVVVTHDSTAAREAFGWGRKVLFCNFSGHENYDSPRTGPWSVTRPDYEEFRRKLDTLRAMASDEYLQCSKEYARYLMIDNDRLPAHRVIRVAVLDALSRTA